MRRLLTLASMMSLALVGCDSPPHAAATASPRSAATQPTPSDLKRVELSNFKRFNVIKQERDVWCWAACAEMIHEFYGRRKISQADLAARIIGRKNLDGNENEDIVKAAQEEEVLAALAPQEWEYLQRRDAARAARANSRGSDTDDLRLNWLAVLASKASASYDEKALIQALEAGEPSVVAFSKPDKHVCVVIGAAYGTTEEKFIGIPIKKLKITEMIVADPWDGQRKVLPASQLDGCIDFTATVETAKLYFKHNREYNKIPLLVHKDQKGPLIERDFMKALKKAGDIRQRVEAGGSL